MALSKCDNAEFKITYYCIVGVSNDERMQSRDECRSRVECRRDDAETRGRAEAEANAEQRTRREQSRGRNENRAEEAAAIAEAEPKPEADAETEEERRRSRAKPAEFRAMNEKCASRNLLERSAAI